MIWWPKSVRFRLALWYAAALTIVLLVYAAAVCLFLRNSLFRELDRQLHEDFELSEELLVKASNGVIRYKALEHHEEEGIGAWVEVWSSDGTLIHCSDSMQRARVSFGDSALPPPSRGYQSVEMAQAGYVRALCEEHKVGGVRVIMRVSRSEERVRRELRELLLIMGLGLPLAIALAGFGGYLIARRALSPIAQMVRQARGITADRLFDRLPVVNPYDELGQLASVFNDTFARLEQSFERLRRFTADASHELRTPLTAIRSVGEVGLQEPRDPERYREVIGSMLEEVDRLSGLVNSLLMLSRADSGQLVVSTDEVRLIDIAKETTAQLIVLAEEKQQSIQVEGEESVIVQADRTLLSRAVMNLIDNAVKYTRKGGHIAVAVSRNAQSAILEVKDTGPGIPAEHLERVFDRFYRVDKARSRELGGAGLGLSIARFAVEASGGKLQVESREGKGTTFRVVLSLETDRQQAKEEP